MFYFGWHGADTFSLHSNYIEKEQYLKPTTRDALLEAYDILQDLAAKLYNKSQKAMDNRDYTDASLLETRAAKIYEEAESIEVILIEMEEP